MQPCPTRLVAALVPPGQMGTSMGGRMHAHDIVVLCADMCPWKPGYIPCPYGGAGFRAAGQALRPLRHRCGRSCSGCRSLRFLFLAFCEIRDHFLAWRGCRLGAKSLVAELPCGRAACVRLCYAVRMPPLVHGAEHCVFRFGRTLSLSDPEHSMHGNRMWQVFF